MLQEQLKAVLRYDPETGIFTRLSNGAIAGSIKTKGYRYIGIGSRRYRAHRLAFLYMTGSMPKQVDHKNGIRDDNRWENLRDASHSQNCQNAITRKDNTSGVKGVFWHKDKKYWIARLKVDGKQHVVGHYKEIAEAEMALKAARQQLHGDFSNHG